MIKNIYYIDFEMSAFIKQAGAPLSAIGGMAGALVRAESQLEAEASLTRWVNLHLAETVVIIESYEVDDDLSASDYLSNDSFDSFQTYGVGITEIYSWDSE